MLGSYSWIYFDAAIRRRLKNVALDIDSIRNSEIETICTLVQTSKYYIKFQKLYGYKSK